MLRRTVSLVLVALLLSVPVLPQNGVPPYKNASLDIDERVKDLLGRMTLEEKVGQLHQLSGGVLTGPQAAGDASAGRAKAAV